jgi:hypothetical protein
MFNPEDNYIMKKTISERMLTENEEKVKLMIYKKTSVQQSAAGQRNLREMDTFRDIYDGDQGPIDKMIKRDKEWVISERNKGTEMEKTERADLLEKIIGEQCESADWFGDSAYVTATTEFDDRKNHTDLIVEWEQDDGRMPKIAIDFTVTEDPIELQNKFRRVIDGIRDRHLTSIKYFQSSKNPDEKGPLDLVPRVVLNVKKEKLDDICRSIIEKKVHMHFIQLYLLLNIEKQLRFQLEYIEKEFNEMTDIPALRDKRKDHMRLQEMKSRITEVFKIIENLIENKKSSLGSEAVSRAENDLETINPQKYFLEV